MLSSGLSQRPSSLRESHCDLHWLCLTTARIVLQYFWRRASALSLIVALRTGNSTSSLRPVDGSASLLSATANPWNLAVHEHSLPLDSGQKHFNRPLESSIGVAQGKQQMGTVVRPTVVGDNGLWHVLLGNGHPPVFSVTFLREEELGVLRRVERGIHPGEKVRVAYCALV